MEDFLLGVNYWPAKKAMYWWQDFDDREIERDFKKIKEIGFNHIRFFLLWEDFQPKINEINKKSIKNLEMVFEIAESLKLKLMPTFFVGHMSGVNWLPSWVLTAGENTCPYPIYTNGNIVNKKVKNIFTDQEIIEAEVKLVEQVVTKYKNHPALYAWDLGNEHSQLHIQVNNQEINKWLNKFTNLIKDIDSDHPTTLGIHQLDIEKDTGFQPQVVSQNCELITMHGYSVYAGWGKGYLDNNVIPFLNYLVSKLSGKRVLFSEFGFATNEQQQPTTEITLTWADNHQQKTYLVAEEEAAKCTIKIIQTLKAMGSLGAFLWCYADYDKSLRKLPPFDRAVQEMSFGITRADGSLKSVARMLKNIQLGEEQNKKKIEILKEKYYQQPLENLMKYYQEYNKDE